MMRDLLRASSNLHATEPECTQNLKLSCCFHLQAHDEPDWQTENHEVGNNIHDTVRNQQA